MPLTRRSLLLGSATAAFGLATGGCGLIGGKDGKTGLPGAADVRGALGRLVAEAGRETFQSVKIHSFDAFGGKLDVELLAEDGGVQKYSYDGTWTKGRHEEPSILTSPVSVKTADLPLDRLTAFTAAAAAQVDTLLFEVDYVGRIRAQVYANSDWIGLKDDGSGRVPELKPESVDDVRAAVAEIVAGYGTAAETVGSFNGFVHVDANVEGCASGVRIIRYPLTAPRAGITQQAPYAPARLFDPSGFDPATAVTRKETIAKDAGVAGTVWDWAYQRPPQGGAPLVSYGIGPKGPSTRVWLDAAGKIAAVVNGECAPGAGWCPK